jgi:4-aminobutyrate aminotransferase-like enzyme
MHPAAMCTLRSACRDHGILYVSDEVQSGFGRAGAMFACERYQIRPDMVAMAKSLAGGMVLSAVTARADIMDAPGIGGIGGTYGGNPLSCAAANAVLDVMEEENLPARANELGAIVMKALDAMAARHAHAANPRGLGSMCAIDLVNPATGALDAAAASRVVAEARQRGLLVMTASGHAVRTLFPLTIAESDLRRGLDILDAAIAAVG